MSKIFRRGDRVEWNSEAGRVRGVILKKVVSDVRIKGYVHHASKKEPQYFIKSERHEFVIENGPMNAWRCCLGPNQCHGKEERH
jgi:hypothetical protein